MFSVSETTDWQRLGVTVNIFYCAAKLKEHVKKGSKIVVSPMVPQAEEKTSPMDS